LSLFFRSSSSLFLFYSLLFSCLLSILSFFTQARTTPSDFVMELVVDPAHRDLAAQRRFQICDQYATAEQPSPPDAASRAALAAVARVAAAAGAQQFRVLLAREVTMRRRMPILFQAIVMRNVVLGALLGLVRVNRLVVGTPGGRERKRERAHVWDRSTGPFFVDPGTYKPNEQQNSYLESNSQK
jgi:hypothetical protein